MRLKYFRFDISHFTSMRWFLFKRRWRKKRKAITKLFWQNFVNIQMEIMLLADAWQIICIHFSLKFRQNTREVKKRTTLSGNNGLALISTSRIYNLVYTLFSNGKTEWSNFNQTNYLHSASFYLVPDAILQLSSQQK